MFSWMSLLVASKIVYVYNILQLAVAMICRFNDGEKLERERASEIDALWNPLAN